MSKLEQRDPAKTDREAINQKYWDILIDAIITGQPPSDMKADMNMKINKEIITNAGIEHEMEVNFAECSFFKPCKKLSRAQAKKYFGSRWSQRGQIA